MFKPNYTESELKALTLITGLKYKKAGRGDGWLRLSQDACRAIAIVDAGFNGHKKSKAQAQALLKEMGIENV